MTESIEQPISFKRVLVANRGEIACRVFRTANELGIETVAVFSEPDQNAIHVREADFAVPLGGISSAESYLNMQRVLAAAKASGADAIHPGYGFLSENPEFAKAVQDAGLIWIGPAPDSITAMALKIEAKNLAEQAGVPLVPGAELKGDVSEAELADLGTKVGFPLLVKASAGGGGKGMRIVNNPDELQEAFVGAKREAASSFGNDAVFLERYLTRARHVEVQVFGDTHGNVVEFGERECSIQRRHQKVIEEAPSPGISEDLRARMTASAVALASKINYLGAGTVEFMVPADFYGNEVGEFFFLEMNTRLQVEHPVTEETHDGIDLVEWQFRVADGQELPLNQSEIHELRGGHAIEVRLYAEDPANNYMPSTGKVVAFSGFWGSPDIREELSIEEGDEVTPHYDPMIAKLISSEGNRDSAVEALVKDLKTREIAGITTNRDQLVTIMESPAFVTGATFTDTLDTRPEFVEPSVPEAVLERHEQAVEFARGCIAADTSDWGLLAPTDFRTVKLPMVYDAPFEASLDETRLVDLDVESADGAAHVELNKVSMGVGTYITVDLYPAQQRDEYPQTAVVQDGTYCTTITLPARFTNPAGNVAEGSSTAPLPGTVVSVEVAVGDEVEAGQTLAVIEAMKMEHKITAGETGTVTELKVSVGDAVSANQVLVHVEANES